MSNPSPQALIADLQQRISGLLRDRSTGDAERIVRALLGQAFQRLDLVTRDEFEAQLERMARLQERIARLEAELDQSKRSQT